MSAGSFQGRQSDAADRMVARGVVAEGAGLRLGQVGGEAVAMEAMEPRFLARDVEIEKGPQLGRASLDGWR